MERSHQRPHQKNRNPSARPSQSHQSSHNQQCVIHQQPHSRINTSIVPSQQEHSDTYCRKFYINRRQTGSISGGLFLILVSGLHIGWGIWRTGLWPLRTDSILLMFTIMAWPIGSVFAGFFGSFLMPLLTKSIIYYITALTMAIGNVLFIIWDDQYAALVVGRLIISLGHGRVFTALISQASENASKNMRGTILSTINCMRFIAIFISGTTNIQLNADEQTVISSERLIGIIALVFILASIICTLTTNVESVPYLLMKNEPNVAKTYLKYLRDVKSETSQITSEMEELTLMTNQDKQEDTNICGNGNGRSLALTIVLRLLVVLTNNFLLNMVLIRACEHIYNIDRYRLATIVIVAPRLIMSVVQIFYADVSGRKFQMILSSTLAGLALIVLGIVINAVSITSDVNYNIPLLFILAFQLFCGIVIDQMADCYLSEAFSMAKKPWSLSFVMLIEHTSHIFLIGMYFITVTTRGQISALIFISGILIVAFGIILQFTLPETRGTTLKEARDLFRKKIL